MKFLNKISILVLIGVSLVSVTLWSLNHNVKQNGKNNPSATVVNNSTSTDKINTKQTIINSNKKEQEIEGENENETNDNEVEDND